MAAIDDERSSNGSASSVPPGNVARLVASMPEPPEASTRRSRRRAIASIIIGMLLWEFVGRFVVTSPILFAPLSKVLVAGWSLFLSGDLVRHVAVSALEFAIGFGLATVLGIALGFAMATSRAVQDSLDPWVSFFYSSPLVWA
jgi:NitT/TauT family transport system permease protein